MKPAQSYDATGQWDVRYTDAESHCPNSGVVETFDAVLVCSGHHVYKYRPHLHGEDTFHGRILHSSEYRTPELFDGQKVAVVGESNISMLIISRQFQIVLYVVSL